MAVTRAYEEIIEFIAAGTSPRGVAEYRPSEVARSRVAELVAREKTTGLTPDDSLELQSALHLEHIMRLAKARARRRLRQASSGGERLIHQRRPPASLLCAGRGPM